MVGGDGGVVGPKELATVSKYCDGHCRNFLPQDVSSREPSVDDHVVRFKNCVDKENRKTCAFTFQNMCFQISDIAKHVL
jgi:hypothetical protein